ncbi:uroporphyrinogen-III C-methyltransferase [Noviherbaspirillum massiliense]|uniref:uroporphyrinogen-III C-methyltransferase n=1 Tax=Noviherbaspirillum massiliense TaxID=1465823 RepID=UPI0003622743
MNEMPIASQSQQAAGTTDPPLQEGASPGNFQMNEKGRRAVSAAKWIYVALGVLTLLLAGLWWNTHKEIRGLRQELARRLSAGDAVNTETKILTKSVQEATKELQAKVNVLESKQAEAQSQQLALEQLYQDLSKNRDDWALAEIEQVLSTASQQLQLAGNVQGALIALQNADSRLSHSDKPQFIGIRRAIARDIERLKALPTVDLPGMALRLDSAITLIDQMPLLSDEKPAVAPTPPKNSRRQPKLDPDQTVAAAKASAAADWAARLEDKWNSWASEMWAEIKQLIQVRNVDTPEALLLSPAQAYYVRENLKLRLLSARLALLSRNESAFRNDIVAAQDAIVKYFDPHAKQTQTVQSLLKQVQSGNLSIEMPTLDDSLTAVRNYKAKP